MVHKDRKFAVVKAEILMSDGNEGLQTKLGQILRISLMLTVIETEIALFELL